VVDDLTGVLQRIVTERIEVTTELTPELWPVLGDASQLEQVLVNLVANARDAMPEGGRVVITTRNVSSAASELQNISEARQGDYVALSVRDTGHGIDEDAREHIFEPFFTTKHHGTGLGLASCYGILKQLGGYICVTSSPGRGTTFDAYLPRSAEDPNASEPVAAPITGGNETLLVAEDDDAVRRTLQYALSAAGYTVLAAHDGEHALALAAEHAGELALLITDVVMPKLSGRQLAERLKVVRPEVQVLFVSGYLDQIELPDQVSGAPLRFLAKPYSVEELLRAVRALIEQSQRDRPRDSR
jgi:CheY-like chemotaxis protein